MPPSRLRLSELYDFDESSSAAHELILALSEDFWPGPLTIIFKAGPLVPDCVTASSGFVGVRCPAHPLAQRLLELADVPVAAPSANRFGHVSPTTSAHVMDDLGAEDLSVLEDDEAVTQGCSVGIESTVCRVSAAGDEIRILRCGAVTSGLLDAALAVRGLHCRVVVDNERAVSKRPADEEVPSVAPGESPPRASLILRLTRLVQAR